MFLIILGTFIGLIFLWNQKLLMLQKIWKKIFKDAPKIASNFGIFSFLGKIIMVDFFHFCPKNLDILEKSWYSRNLCIFAFLCSLIILKRVKVEKKLHLYPNIFCTLENCNAWKKLSNLITCMLHNKGWFCFWLLPTILSVISHE